MKNNIKTIEEEKIEEVEARNFLFGVDITIEAASVKELKIKLEKIEESEKNIIKFLLEEEGENYFDGVRKMRNFKQLHTFEISYYQDYEFNERFGVYTGEVRIYFNIEFKKPISKYEYKKVTELLGVC